MASQSRESRSPSVTVVVLNFNGLEHLEPCYSSLRRLDYPADQLELMLMDNGSSDGSAGYIRSAFPEVTVISHPETVGFASGNNIAARAARGDYVVFLNNDMRVDPGFVRGLVDGVSTDDNVVAAGALILSWDGSAVDFGGAYCNYCGIAAQRDIGRRYQPGSYVANEPMLFACGGAMIVDREVFLDVGGFDDSYFIYFEDVDLGWRLWLYGYTIVFAPRAIARHRHHGTTGVHPNAKLELFYRRNALATVIKNYSDANLGRVLPAALLATASSVSERAVEAGGIDPRTFSLQSPSSPGQASLDASATASLLAVGGISESLPEIFQRRKEVQERRVRSDEDIAHLFRPMFPALPWHLSETGYRLFEMFGVVDLFTSSPRRVLVVSPDVLPYPGLPTVGSALRAWGLGQGLRTRGHDVVFSMPRAAVDRYRSLVTAEVADKAWGPFGIREVVERVQPDVVLLCGWAIVGHLTDQDASNRVPVIVDQHGPHMLERRFSSFGNTQSNSRAKTDALVQADYFTCAGRKQLAYFGEWLAKAQWCPAEASTRAAAVPFSLSPELPTHQPPDGITFVFGGVFLPWQDPTAALVEIAARLSQEGRGRLKIFGGKHPFYEVDPGPIVEVLEVLEANPRVTISEPISHGALLEEYSQAHVAIDLMRRNPERELAFTSRTVEYLWCGLPVIYNDYAELADYIRRYEAGWTVDPDDPEALAEVLTQIFESPELVAERGRNAQELVRAELTWDKTIGPLDAFVRRATLRRPHPVAVPGGTPSASEATFASGPPVPEVVTRTVVRLHRTLPPGVRHAMRRGLGALVGEHTPRNRNGLPVEVIAAVERLRRLTSRAAQ